MKLNCILPSDLHLICSKLNPTVFDYVYHWVSRMSLRCKWDVSNAEYELVMSLSMKLNGATNNC